MKKVFSLVMVAAALLGLMLVPASAAEIEGDFSVSYYYGKKAIPSSLMEFTVTAPRSMYVGGSYPGTSTGEYTGSLSEFVSTTNLDASGSVALYFSFYFSRSQLSSYSLVGSGFADSTWLAYWYNQDGIQFPVDSFSVSTFNSTDISTSTDGWRVAVRVDSVPEGSVLSKFHLMRPDYSLNYVSTLAGYNGALGICFPSISVVATEVSSDLLALEGIADGIVETNAILSAFYGDVMTILNNMYSRMGDMLAVEQAANTYLSEIVQKLNDIDSDTSIIVTLLQSYLHYLEEISGTASDIEAELESFHRSFSNAIDYLVRVLGQEFGLTRDAIEDAVEMLIQYLDSTFASAISPDMGTANDDLSACIDDNHVIEQAWTGSLATDWAALELDKYQFDSQYTNAFMVVSLWFSNIFSAFGSFGSVLIFPMVVGICMLILGVFRMGFSRSYSGRNQSKGGGSGA